MNIHDLQAETNAIYQAIAQMESSEAQDIVKKIFNLIERLASDKLSLETELQQLRDEVNRLKGEQGKPDIKPNKNNKGDDISSEDERKKHKLTRKKKLITTLKIRTRIRKNAAVNPRSHELKSTKR
ncbi:MAG: hypothetical protein Q9M50_10805 [Methylococcales bacterium]|nr:hypothetical protein [Methylococcales bacterium]MDQ7091114.1 hypothetical protein [Methylococcales bacterium]